jgi:hypothetical protein
MCLAGFTGAEGRAPEEVFVGAEFDWVAGSGGDAGAVGAAEAGPFVCVESEGQEEESGGRAHG